MARQKAKGRSDHILNCALTQFAKFGFAKTTIQDIAKASGVASGTIYLYYKSKDEILKACAERFHTTHKEYAKSILASSKAPNIKLREYLLNRRALWENETANSGAGTDLAQAMINTAPEINEAEKAVWMETLRSILKEGENKDLYRFDSLTKELKIFLHCLIGFFPLPGVRHPFAPTERDLVNAIDWFDRKWRSHGN